MAREGHLGWVLIEAVYISEGCIMNTFRVGDVTLVVMLALSFMPAICVRLDEV